MRSFFQRPFFQLLVLCVCCLMQLGGSCESSGGYESGSHNDRYPEGGYSGGSGGDRYPDSYPPPDRYPPDQYPPPSRPPDYYPPPSRPPVYYPPPSRPPVYYPPDDRYPEYDRPNRIPRWSDLVEDKEGKIRWTADLDGSIYVYDVSKDFIRYTGPIRRGQELIVQPGDDIIYIQQRAVSHENLRRDARHQVFFARERSQSGRPDTGRPPKEPPPDPGRTIPKGSVRVAQGKGDLAINAARGHGTVYVFDENDKNVVWTQDLDKGNSFQIFVAKGYVNVNSKRGAAVKFRAGHTFSLYFKDK